MQEFLIIVDGKEYTMLCHVKDTER